MLSPDLTNEGWIAVCQSNHVVGHLVIWPLRLRQLSCRSPTAPVALVIPAQPRPSLGSRDSGRPTSEPLSSDKFRCVWRHLFLPVKLRLFGLGTTSLGWLCNYTLWQQLIGWWETGLKGFVGILTGSCCCMTNELCERWATLDFGSWWKGRRVGAGT